MALVGSDLNLITLVLGPVMITIGGVYGVHVFARYEVVASSSADARSAALESLRHTIAPVLISGCTTMVGFAALLINEIPATSDLGGFCVFGVASITVITLTGVPAALALLPLRSDDGSGRALYAAQTRLARRCGARWKPLGRRRRQVPTPLRARVLGVTRVAPAR
jgi:predicted RND superfamily exporter protein